MSGELSLDKLISSMQPELVDGVFVFVTLGDRTVTASINPRMVFQEAEGTTLIALKSEAETAGLSYEFPCRMITLNIHSSLEAVGFLAKITAQLAAHGMGVNPVSAFFHDHLFVPNGREDEAMEILRSMAEN